MGPVLVILTTLIAFYLTLRSSTHTSAIFRPVPPIWLLIEADGGFRIADPQLESMDAISMAQQAHVIVVRHRRRLWGRPLIFASSRTPVMTLLPAEGTDPIALTPKLRRLAMAHWAGDFSESDTRLLLTDQRGSYQFRPISFIIDAVLWVCGLMGLSWSVRLVPLIERNRRRFLSRHRFMHLLCPGCRYSLAGLEQPITQCPECGCSWTPPQAHTSTSEST